MTKFPKYSTTSSVSSEKVALAKEYSCFEKVGALTI